MPPIPRRIANINMTPGPEMKDVSWVMHPTGKKPNPIPAALMENGGKHHPEVRELIKGERLPQFQNSQLRPLPIDADGNKFIPDGKTLHDVKYIRKINQAAGYSDQPGLAWERANVNRLSDEAKLSSVPASNQFYTLDESLDDLTEIQQMGARGANFQDEIYLRNGANLNDSLSSLGERQVLITDQNNLLDRFRQEFGDKVPYDAEKWYNSPVRSIMPESDALDFAPQNRFAKQRNVVRLPGQVISSPQEQAAIRAGLEMDTPRPLGSFTMNTRSVRVGEMPEVSPIKGAYLPDGKGYKLYTPSADLNQRNDELNNLLVDVGGQKVPYIGSATAEIAGHELVRDPDIMPDSIEAMQGQQQKAARIRGQAGVSQYSPTAPNAEPMWRSADSALDELNQGANTLRAVQAIDPAHNIASQGFDVSVDVAPGQPTTQAYNALKRHGLSVDVGGSGVNNVLSATGELPVNQQVELARSLRSTLNPTGGMMGLADADPEMAGLREQWKQQREAMAVDPIRQAKVDDAIARVRAENGLGMMKPPAPRQTIEVLNEDNMPRPIARRSRRVDDDWLGIAEPSMADLGIPAAVATPPQQGFTLVGSPATVLSTSRPPRSAAETFFQQNYGVPQERALVPSPQARTFTSDLPPAQPEEIPSRALMPYRGQGLSTNAQFDFAPDVDWREAPTMPGEMGQQPNWIIPSAIASGVLGAGALGYGLYNSKQEEEQRKRQAVGW